MISINYRDSRPVYEQIVDGFKKLIMTGLIKKDEKMPSVRELASQYA
ncbi:MAG: GntR family transcriptional regulator, partial [Lachnospiraceae bacterium]|nr:GntR family transcriptional regulator [Lachnospiraceae bacterium]